MSQFLGLELGHTGKQWSIYGHEEDTGIGHDRDGAQQGQGSKSFSCSTSDTDCILMQRYLPRNQIWSWGRNENKLKIQILQSVT